MTTNLQPSKCWAFSLGDCDGKLSGEHYVSKSQFSGTSVVAHGLSWCRDEPKLVGINSLTKKILCRKHNTALCSLDSAAKHLLDAFEEIGNRESELRNGRSRLPFRVFPVAGEAIERWLLKTAINLTFDPAAPESRPDPRYVRIVFGLDHFTAQEGLHWVVDIGDTVNRVGIVQFTPHWQSIDDKTLIGAEFNFHGHCLWLALAGAREIDAIHPINRMNVEHVSMAIQFDWASQRKRHFKAARKRREARDLP